MGVLGLRDTIQRFRGGAKIADDAHEAFDVIGVEVNPLLHCIADEHAADREARLVQLLEGVFCVCTPAEGASIGLFMDGPAPLGKLPVQRMRRAKYPHTRLDITPGTKYLDAVAKALISWGTEFCKTRKDVTILVSSSNVPGEGECKLVRWLRSLRGKVSQEAKICSVGCDMDLLMATLAQDYWHNKIVYDSVGRTATNTGTLSFYLSQHLAELTPQHVHTANLDFVSLALFNGSDYLPTLPGFDATATWAAYCKRNTEGVPLVSSDFTPNLALLKGVLKKADGSQKKKNKKKATNGGGSGSPRKYLLTWLWSVKMLVTGTCPSYKYTYDMPPPDFDELMAFLRKMEEKDDPIVLPGDSGDRPPEPLLYLGCTLPCTAYDSYLPKQVVPALLREEALADVALPGCDVVAVLARCYAASGVPQGRFAKETLVTCEGLAPTTLSYSNPPCTLETLAFTPLLGVGHKWRVPLRSVQSGSTGKKPMAGACAVVAVVIALVLGLVS
eukprot:TRINITY_DN14420_c0_g1_i1.p1 TRINITY_DN14420_c0_g1~~TRINITY_DN14420_c0_g1_i1.p1  ORF type:complete len:501 (+),score=123.84 TRINITY_DN14420_c0_g1_i1:1076-2578(+)